MLHTSRAYNGMVVAPHHLAAQSGLAVLREGGNAIEAMIAAAASIAVVYPHMNNLGGDNFWLIRLADGRRFAIDACGGAAALATPDWYREQGHQHIPDRGPLAALTVAGAVSGWGAAQQLSQQALQGKLPLERLLEDARAQAEAGVAVSTTLAANAAGKLDQLRDVPGFASTYCTDGVPLSSGTRLRQPAVAATLEQLARAGLDDFYRGDLAKQMAAELEAAGSPLRLADLQRHQALDVEPLELKVGGHTVYNLPPPTQGLASLLLLGVYDRLPHDSVDDFNFVHALVEATKCAFRIRDQHVCDPDYMEKPASAFLSSEILDELAARVDHQRAAPWPDAATGGDTVWLGAVDKHGNSVSFIQSIYWEFGSGMVLPGSGVTWQNRGISFALDPNHFNCLAPHRRPFHTIQPALAELADGRVMPFGTMGGEGQPQTQAMVFTRHVMHDQPLQQSVSAPRWLLGRTWGSEATNLRIESRFDEAVYRQLAEAGHDVERIGDYDDVMGHAGALVHHPDGLIEAAADPRSDGCCAGF